MNDFMLYSETEKLSNSFGRIRHNMLDLNNLVSHVGKLTGLVESLSRREQGRNNFFHQAHLNMLNPYNGPAPEGMPAPWVRDLTPWLSGDSSTKHSSYTNILEYPYERVFFWSDLHFFHKKVIEYTGRPFTDLDEMHEALVQNYNAIVGPYDVCVFVGDLTFGNKVAANALLDRMDGYKIQVLGNHDFDRHSGKRIELNFDEVHTSMLVNNLIITHHPWCEKLPNGFFNIHGHMHNRAFDAPQPRHFNVSVEMVDFKPISLEEILAQSHWNTLDR